MWVYNCDKLALSKDPKTDDLVLKHIQTITECQGVTPGTKTPVSPDSWNQLFYCIAIILDTSLTPTFM
jgi:hypothetical protein